MNLFRCKSFLYTFFLFLTLQANASFKADTIRAGNDYRKAIILADSARFDSALYYFNQASVMYKHHKVWEKYLQCRGMIFKYRREKGEKYDAMAFVFENLKLAKQKLGEKNTITGNCYNQIGNCYADEETNDTAIIYFKKALYVWNNDPKHNQSVITNAYLNIGMMLSEKASYDSARNYFEKALELRKKMYGENHLSVAEVYNSFGSLYYYLGNFNKSLESFEKVLSIRQNSLGNNHPDVAKAYNNIGAVYQAMGKYNEALEADQAALKIRLATLGPNHFNVALSYNNIGNIYSDLEEYTLSNEYHSKALQIRLKLFGEKNANVIMSYTNIGINYMFMGIYDEAMKMLKKVENFDLEKYGEFNRLTAECYNNLGAVYEGMGEWDSALFYFNKALNIRMKIFSPHHPSLAGNYGNIGSVCKSKGDYETALRYFLEQLTIVKENYSDENKELTDAYTNLGAVYIEMNQYGKALFYLNKSLELQRKLLGDQSPVLASTFVNISNIYSYQKKYNDAADYLLKAISLRIKSYGEKNPKVAEDYSNLAATYFDMNDTAKAFEIQQKAIEIFNEIYAGKYFGLAMAYNNLGDFYQSLNRYEKSLKYYQSALIANSLSFSSTNPSEKPTFEKILDKQELLKTFEKKATIFYKMYRKSNNIKDLISALKTINSSVDLVADLRLSYKLNESKLFFVEQASGIYSLASEIIYLLYVRTKDPVYLSQLFNISQQSKSQVLAEAVEQSQVAKYAGIPDSIVKQQKEYKTILDAAEAKLLQLKFAEKSDSLDIKKLEEKVFQYSVQYKNIADLIETKFPRYDEMMKINNLPTLYLVQKNLNIETAWLDYSVTDSALFLLCITTNKASVYRMNIDSSFRESVENMLAGIRKNHEEQAKSNAMELYKKLINPVSSELSGKKRLLIIPDKFLLYLPFEALINKTNKPLKEKNVPDYLVTHFDIVYNYSAAFAFNHKEMNDDKVTSYDNTTADFIGFAPVFQNTSNEVKIFASNDTLSKFYAALRSVTIDGKNYKPLINTEQEVVNIVNLFTNKGLKGIGFLHNYASVNNFKKEIGHYRYVHIATHGISNDEYPALSGLVFAPENTDSSVAIDPEKNAGVLFTGEIYDLKLNAELVVLSSCESGTGKLIKGEGLMSLTRGFIYAGVPKIVYSLWKVDDKSTCDLMTQFYKELLENNSTEKALRDAKLKLLNNPATSSPRYWAAFELLGN